VALRGSCAGRSNIAAACNADTRSASPHSRSNEPFAANNLESSSLNFIEQYRISHTLWWYLDNTIEKFNEQHAAFRGYADGKNSKPNFGEDGQADCDARRAIRRRIQVHAPNDKIPKPGGKGLDQTNAETVQTYLDQICPFGTPEVSASTGNAGMGDMECIFPDQLGVGCGCICELDEAPVTVTIHVRDEGMKIKGADSTSPHTTATGFGAETGQGTGSDVIVPSPNDTVEYCYADVTGAKQAFSNCEILGHELCGHARLNARGTHPRDQLNKEVRHGHETVVPMENAIRNERGITNRDRGAGAADPYCGESFQRKKGAATFEDKDAKHLAACRHLRIFYLERLKWARKKLPPDEQVKLTPLKKTYDVSERLPEK
jgi:hypothetical protein